MNTGAICTYARKQLIKVGAAGARGTTKNRNLGIEVDCTVRVSYLISNTWPIISKYLVPVIYSIGSPGGFVASGSSLVFPRAAADTRGQYSTLHYTGASVVRYAMQEQQGRAQERRRERRDEGTGEGTKEGARNVGGKATGAWVLGDRGMR